MSVVQKSYEGSVDPLIDYCSKLTIVQHPLQKHLQDITLKEAKMAQMLGAPEVLTFGQNFIHLIGGKKVLDIGTFTGASALAWSLAVGDNGQVYTFDIDHTNYKHFGVPVIKQDKDVFSRIIAQEGPAVESLEALVAQHAGTFDFAFIDADKLNYTNYYNLSMKLLRSGGVILVDNALWDGRVAIPEKVASDENTKAIDQANRAIFADDRSNSALINTGDGLHIAFKK